ncbi:MAG TPA: CoA pyrophosphatase [Solirubrobacteraceae bacterium]|nr:CoA pyrophosphatase [Solirubrobacteraceae bacterium]
MSSAGVPDWSSAQRAAPGEQTLAAVLVPLFVAAPSEPPHVVLTRRRADLRRHAGEISFPGGRRDPGDVDLAATALREAHEEIGLAPDAVELIGELPAISTFATNYLIHPFVGLIEPGQQWLVSPREVDVVLELPLAAVQQSKTRTDIERRGIKFEVDAYVLDGNLIWGATFRILADLFERLRQGGPDGRPALAG